MADAQSQLATFAGGCFWCMEAPFHATKGVIDVVSGYISGRESVQISYDPNQVSYKELLDIYWLQIDPTDAGGQFYDRGHEYTTAIYFHNEEQQQLAEQSKKDRAKLFDKPIATLILPTEEFHKAENYHQDFFQKSAERYAQFKKLSGREDFIEENKRKSSQ
jgi:peptide methionine sulfoxide reductase msrA/msrB